MKTPEEKYMNDPQYRMMVDFLIKQVSDYNFTPSEMREMTMFACVRAEQLRSSSHRIFMKNQVGDENG